jgi:hypothetical protein
MNELLQDVTADWTAEEITAYIELLQKRLNEKISETHALIRELKILRNKKRRKQTPDNGTRGGM